MRCRSCWSTSGEVVLDLGMQPPCEYFPRSTEPMYDEVFPLRLWLCAGCGLAQLADDSALPNELTGVEPAALAHQWRESVASVGRAGLLHAGATVAEAFSPHGGSWWDAGMAEFGVLHANAENRADVVIDGSFGLMHAPDQAAALSALVARLDWDGVILLQFHSLAAMLRGRQWNAVRLGHYAYYSVPAVQQMLAPHGLTITNVWCFPLYGGTVLVAARRGAVPDPSVAVVLDEERAMRVSDPRALQMLGNSVDVAMRSLQRFTTDARAAGIRVYGYGAASRAVALVYLAGMQADQLLGVADAAPGKHGCRMPGTSVPVISPAQLIAARPDVVVVFVSELLPEVRSSLPQIEEAGGRWIDVETVLSDPERTSRISAGLSRR